MQRSLGPARKACTRCRLHKRRCNNAQPSCSLCTRLGQLCIYKDVMVNVTLPMTSTSEAPKVAPCLEELTPSGIKANITRSLSSTNPREIMTIYSQTIHRWFAIFSETVLSDEHPTTWDSTSVDFTLLCFTIGLLHSTPQESEGIYTLDSEHKSKYLMSKSWIALLEGAGLNSIDFVKARLLVTVFEVAHGFYPAVYLSIAATTAAADALIVPFQQQGISPSFSEKDMQEYRIMWAGIAILDRYITTESGSMPALTRGRQLPPDTPICAASRILEITPTPFARLFEASLLLDNVNRAVHQPTLEQSFNIEEMIMIIRTLQSLETVVDQSIPEINNFFASCLTFSSIAKLLAFDHGCKLPYSDQANWCHSQAIVSLNTVIDIIVEMVAVLNSDNSDTEKQAISPFATFLIYKTAAITTERLQAGLNPEVNLRKLRVLRNGLKLLSKLWVSGERYLNLLNQDTTPRILKAVKG